MHIMISAGFILLTIGSYALLLTEIKKVANTAQKPRFTVGFLVGLVIWILFTSIWSLTGRMSNFAIFPLNMVPVLVIPLIAVLVFVFSKTGREVLVRIPIENIVRLQAFRFFVELLLWALYLGGEAPVQMTFGGRNWDVLSGISAPIVAFLVAKGKISTTGVVIWNLLCLGLLINIVSVAILSMPTPLRVFMNDPSNTIVTRFPVSWLPALLVPLAYGLHFISLRQLSLKR
ncbi:MAG TPA: hypothetical protein VKQ08_05425 [Cyclobacteriaceae bacterium]|nr:hypothetical protein [Cyclobacteriaceae bacterium]